MEKKTIGGFIAVLRRAAGMTQKELAERLNVSDKTVSRWERDEGEPDLSLIPVIAEMFNVTCDELLRGERVPQTDRPDPAPERSAKGERERQRLLRSALSKFKGRVYISMGVTTAGLMAALVCNFAFLRAKLGFFLGAALYLAGVVATAVFLNSAMLSVDDEETGGAEISVFKRRIALLARDSVILAAAYLGFTVPLTFVGAYMGLRAESLLVSGAAYAAIFLGVCAVAWYFLDAYLLKRGVYALDERREGTYWHNHRLKGACAGVLAAVAAVTAFFHVICISPNNLMKGTVFTDFDSFKEFMERDTGSGTGYEGPEPPAEDNALDGVFDEAMGSFWYNTDVAEPDRDDSPTLHIYDGDGNVLCTYLKRNTDVVRVRYPASGLPITVYTRQDEENARRSAAKNNAIFVSVYIAEAAAALAFYLAKREKRGG